jgi:hypothetical protein
MVLRWQKLDSDVYRQIESNVIALGEKATSADEFMNGFNAVWRNGAPRWMLSQSGTLPLAAGS